MKLPSGDSTGLISRKAPTTSGIGLASPKVGRAQMSQFVVLPWLEYTMYFPSRDQSEANLNSSLFSRSFSSPWPLAGFSNRSGTPLRFDEKTIRVPSGDHKGEKLLPVAEGRPAS